MLTASLQTIGNTAKRLIQLIDEEVDEEAVEDAAYRLALWQRLAMTLQSLLTRCAFERIPLARALNEDVDNPAGA